MKNDKSGVYAIECSANGKRYIGSSVGAHNRWYQHRRLLRKGKHTSPYLQHAFNFYGVGAFRFCLIEKCQRDLLEIREQYHINTLKPASKSITDIKRRYEKEMLAKRAAS